MYESFFGLHKPAFSINPDPEFLWLSETHREGLAVLLYGISRRKGFILLTGEVGAGKTTLMRAAISQLPADLLDVPEVAMVTNTAELTPLDLLKFICAEYDIQPAGEAPTKADYLIALNRFLIRQLRGGITAVLVIDEAQNLSLTALEQVRLLSNLEHEGHKLLQIVLMGQPELRRKLLDPRVRQLRQRIAIEHHLEPLTAEDTQRYLAHRIRVAGGRPEGVFAPGCEQIFHEFSSGCPRLVNVLADRVLLAAYAHELRPVPPSLVELKAKDLSALRFQDPRA